MDRVLVGSVGLCLLVFAALSAGEQIKIITSPNESSNKTSSSKIPVEPPPETPNVSGDQNRHISDKLLPVDTLREMPIEDPPPEPKPKTKEK